MARHGGGSRSGGSSRSSSSRSGGGSRGGGSSVRTSSTPFRGCYNRSYYDRHGRFHSYYTSNRYFGTQKGTTTGIKFVLAFITFHMLLMVGGFSTAFVQFGGKVSGDPDRIYIEDHANVLTASEEKEVLELLEEVYDKSGMPVTVYTDDFSWMEHYDSLSVYSEELYYQIGYEEDAMIIVFTTDNGAEFYDWEYDICCGDDTIKCFSDETFDKLLSNFHKGMANQNLAEALEYSWNSVMGDLAKVTINWSGLPIILFLLAFYSVFYIVVLGSTKKQNDAYRYFQENPQMLSSVPMMVHAQCPSCGAANAEQKEVCEYCGSLLKITNM